MVCSRTIRINSHDRNKTVGRIHAGEELQEPETFTKSVLVFPSDEELPRCWVDAGYRHPVT